VERPHVFPFDGSAARPLSPGGSNSSGRADRLPPQNLEAEAGVIGSVMLDNDLLDPVVKILPTPAPFYRDAHQIVWRAVLDLYREAKPVDAISLEEVLSQTDQIRAVGGVEGLAAFVAGVPHAVQGVYYAGIVREKAITRELIEIAGLILRDGYSNNFTAGELVNAAQARIFDLAEGQSRDRLRAVCDILPGVMDAIDRQSQGGELIGLGTPWCDLDDLTGGFQSGQLIVVAARPSVGKAQPLDARVLTPWGFAPMGQIKVGHHVIGADGQAARVVGVYPQGELPVYRVTMSDGGRTECCEDHLWFTQTRKERRQGIAGSVKTLKEIMRTLSRMDGDAPNHAIPLVNPVHFDSPAELLLHPYAMGLLLGDGSFTGPTLKFSNPELEIRERLARFLPRGDTLVSNEDGLDCRIKRSQKNNEPSRTRRFLSDYGLEGKRSYTKFIPPEYLIASEEDRLWLLQGLMDTDGSVTHSGRSVEYSTSSPDLAQDVASLARSLGGVVSVRSRIPAYTYKGEKLYGSESFRLVIYFPNGFIPVSSSKHLAKWKVDESRQYRSIVSVEPVGFKVCQCIKVDAQDQLYVTDDYIVIHNTSIALNMADYFAFEIGSRTLFVSLEMDANSLVTRMVGSRGRIASHQLRFGHGLGHREITALGNARQAMSEPVMWIDDAPCQSMIEIMATARGLARRHGLGAIVVDYIQLVDPEDSRVSRQEQVARISRRLKQLARELNVPVIALSQLNRALENREDHRPRLADLKESGAIEQDADMVLFIHRPDYFDKDAEYVPVVETEVILAKNRSGATGTVKLGFQRACMRFEQMAPSAVQHPEEGRY
jgi:replicative DNA helicase